MRQSGAYRLGLPYSGYDYGSPVGQAGVGRLLDMGSQGDVGGSYVALLSVVFAHQRTSQGSKYTLCSIDFFIPASADVLVWYQLPAIGAGRKYSCILV